MSEVDYSTVTKAELVEVIFRDLGLNKREAKELVEQFFDEMADALAAGEPVRLSGFGNFELADKGRRPGRNPKTGKEVPITARRVVSFKAGQKLKQRVEGYAGSGQ
jgi:integration host factor subunit alpha